MKIAELMSKKLTSVWEGLWIILSPSNCQPPVILLLVFRVHFLVALLLLVLGGHVVVSLVIQWLNDLNIAASILRDSISMVVKAEAELLVLFSQKDRSQEDEAEQYNANYCADASVGGIGIGVDCAPTHFTVVLWL